MWRSYAIWPGMVNTGGWNPSNPQMASVVKFAFSCSPLCIIGSRTITSHHSPPNWTSILCSLSCALPLVGVLIGSLQFDGHLDVLVLPRQQLLSISGDCSTVHNLIPLQHLHIIGGKCHLHSMRAHLSLITSPIGSHNLNLLLCLFVISWATDWSSKQALNVSDGDRTNLNVTSFPVNWLAWPTLLRGTGRNSRLYMIQGPSPLPGVHGPHQGDKMGGPESRWLVYCA